MVSSGENARTREKVLMERPQILHWCLLYMQALKKYLNVDKNIIYIVEIWVHNDMTVKNVVKATSIEYLE